MSIRARFGAAAERLDRPNRVWFAISSMLVVLLAIAGVALVSLKVGYDSRGRTIQIANCINDVLDLRQNVQSSDSKVVAAIFDALDRVLSAPPGAQQDAAYQAFTVVLANGKKSLADNQDFRDKHPLGRC